MNPHPTTHHTTLGRGLFAEAGDALGAVERVRPAGASAGRALAVLTLLGVVLVLMIAPALVAGLSLLDSHLLDRTQSWFDWTSALTRYLDLGHLGSTLALLGIVSRAKEDQ